MALLEVDNLEVRYRTAAGEAKAVDGVSFAIEAGMCLGLVGESGCGKSTVAKAILGILPPAGSDCRRRDPLCRHATSSA